jgi:CRP/FNR family transcriptional regulator, cyclic AMP receptor protein
MTHYARHAEPPSQARRQVEAVSDAVGEAALNGPRGHHRDGKLARAPEVGFVLDLDPDLGVDLPAEEWDAARNAARGPLLTLVRGDWNIAADGAEHGATAGFLLGSGVIARELSLGGRHLIELLGPGDVIHIPCGGDASRPLRDATHTVIGEARALGLGGAFVRSAARWPSLLSAMLARIECQRQRFAVQALIVHLPRAQERVLLMLWHLCSHWGYVSSDGIHLPLRITHHLLGQLTAAERSTVSLAIGELAQAGWLERLDDGTWLLTPGGQAGVTVIIGSSPAASLSQTLSLQQRSGDLIHDARALQASARQTRAQMRPRSMPGNGGAGPAAS